LPLKKTASGQESPSFSESSLCLGPGDQTPQRAKASGYRPGKNPGEKRIGILFNYMRIDMAAKRHKKHKVKNPGPKDQVFDVRIKLNT
jgi:hypothetical protein